MFSVRYFVSVLALQVRPTKSSHSLVGWKSLAQHTAEREVVMTESGPRETATLEQRTPPYVSARFRCFRACGTKSAYRALSSASMLAVVGPTYGQTRGRTQKIRTKGHAHVKTVDPSLCFDIAFVVVAIAPRFPSRNPLRSLYTDRLGSTY
jgi:hypothetical protein